MRILITIPHYVRLGEAHADGRRYGAVAADPVVRVGALTACLTALHRLFGAPPCFIDHHRRTAHVHVATVPYTLTVVICTTGDETTATLGIMRTFKVYRPALANADFLEVQHAGTGYLEQLRSAPVGEGEA